MPEVRSTAMLGAWCAFLGTLARPRRTFADLESHPHAGRSGAVVLLAVSLCYTLILAAYVSVGYPAAARSAVGVAAEEQYRWQIWYQAPLFFATTATAAAVLFLIARWSDRRASFGVAFGRISLATAVPFALTTMVVEAAVAAFLLVGVLEPASLLRWLTGPGAWFALLHQAVGLTWLGALVLVATRVTLRRGWVPCGAVAVLLLVVYAIPIALLIR